MSFNNKIIVITGGSKGFGKALAEAFLKDGAKVIITSDNEPELKATSEEIDSDYLVADASSYDNNVTISDSVVAKYGRIDVWINNAGIQIAPSNVEDVDVGKLHKLFGINFYGYFYGCMVAIRVMKTQGSGLIINVNSTAGLGGKPELSAYVSSKFAIKGLTETIREEVKNSEIKAYQVFPGGMQTDIYKEKVPTDIVEYMQVDTVVEKIMTNLKLDSPDPDLVIKRPI